MATTGSDDAITFVISVAAELAGMHPQTLRQYDRLGLVTPCPYQGAGSPLYEAGRAASARRAADEPGRGHQPGGHPTHPRARAARRGVGGGARRPARGRRRGRSQAHRVFAASADGQVMPMRRGQRPWDSSLRPEARSGGSLTVWNPVRALAALASSEAFGAFGPLPAAPRSNGRAVIEGTIVSRR